MMPLENDREMKLLKQLVLQRFHHGFINSIKVQVRTHSEYPVRSVLCTYAMGQL